jgi:hypothetical protein
MLVRQALIVYRPTVDSLTSIPSISSSPWIRGEPPQPVLSAHTADQLTDFAIDSGPSATSPKISGSSLARDFNRDRTTSKSFVRSANTVPTLAQLSQSVTPDEVFGSDSLKCCACQAGAFHLQPTERGLRFRWTVTTGVGRDSFPTERASSSSGAG